MDEKLKDKQLEQVSGGNDDRYRKDLYENIILGATQTIRVSPEEHNVMLNSTNDE